MIDGEGTMSPEVLSRLAAGLRLPLGAERAAELAERVRGTLVFTSELDQLGLDEAGPATVFSPLDD